MTGQSRDAATARLVGAAAEAGAAPPDVFVLPGPVDTPTGGFRYDRRIIQGLQAVGHALQLVTLTGNWPRPTPVDLARANAAFQALADGSRVIVDGLALGAMPDIVARQAQRLRLIGLVHHPLWLEAATAEEQRRQQPADALRQRLRRAEMDALAAVREVIVTSAPTAAALAPMQVPAERLTVIEPGCDPRALARGSEDGRLALVCVATITPRKGHLALIDALATVSATALRTAQALPPWRLELIGSLSLDPTHVAEVRARIEGLGLSQQIRLRGELEEAELEQCYLGADAMVLASRYEGYGMSLVEALMHGLPLVVTRGGAIADTVAGGARLVPADDPAALARAISESLFDPQGRRQLAARARRWRERHGPRLGWPRAVQQFQQILDRV